MVRYQFSDKTIVLNLDDPRLQERKHTTFHWLNNASEAGDVTIDLSEFYFQDFEFLLDLLKDGLNVKVPVSYGFEDYGRVINLSRKLKWENIVPLFDDLEKVLGYDL